LVASIRSREYLWRKGRGWRRKNVFVATVWPRATVVEVEKTKQREKAS
jgi:hypothetical protein